MEFPLLDGINFVSDAWQYECLGRYCGLLFALALILVGSVSMTVLRVDSISHNKWGSGEISDRWRIGDVCVCLLLIRTD